MKEAIFQTVVIEKDPSCQIRVEQTEQDGRHYIDCREYRKDSELWIATNNVFSIPFDGVMMKIGELSSMQSRAEELAKQVHQEIEAVKEIAYGAVNNLLKAGENRGR